MLQGQSGWRVPHHAAQQHPAAGETCVHGEAWPELEARQAGSAEEEAWLKIWEVSLISPAYSGVSFYLPVFLGLLRFVPVGPARAVRSSTGIPCARRSRTVGQCIRHHVIRPSLHFGGRFDRPISPQSGASGPVPACGGAHSTPRAEAPARSACRPGVQPLSGLCNLP